MPQKTGISLSWAWCGVLLYFPLFLIHLPSLVTARPHVGYLIANPSTTWTNISNLNGVYSGEAEYRAEYRIILYSSSKNAACGFFCIETCNHYLFAIFNISYYYDDNVFVKDDLPVWSANQKNPVSIDATLQLSSERGLVLRDSDETIAWSTNIGNKSVAGLKLTDMGHLVLLDKNNETIWQSFDHPTDSLVLWPTHGYLKAKPSTSWTNTLSAPDYVKFRNGSTVRIILNSGSSGPVFACGFVCNEICNNYLFAIFVLYIDADIQEDVDPQVVWSANQKNPVSINATLQLSSERGLVLQDANGTTVWSTNISTKSVAGLNLTDTGNLMLLNQNNETIWQSFDHPTDSLLPGQKLMVGQKLTSSAATIYQIEGALFSLSVSSQGLFAFIESNISKEYFSFKSPETSYIQFLNGSFAFSSSSYGAFPIPLASSLQYMRFGPDGHLRVYEWKQKSLEWKEVADLLTDSIGSCGYPTVCGTYGICTNGQCSCPGPKNGTDYFMQVNDRLPDHGCSLITPLSCKAYQDWSILELKNISYVNIDDLDGEFFGIDSESCKQACLKNCSCKAATYHQDLGDSLGYCFLQSQIFSLISDTFSLYTVYIKVQNVPGAITLSPGSVPSREQKNHGKEKKLLLIILGSGTSLFGLFGLIGILVLRFLKNKDSDEAEECYLDHVPGLLTRYSFGDLQAMTENFNKKLGSGGFGTVFEGSLINGTKVAVKRLHGFSQIKKSFLAEVETIGSIHHFNLVRVIGFCAQRSHSLLVYEYMPNGSLDKWIFQRTHEFTLDWHRRKKIILDIAKGLTYLHEDCNKKIAHLDVKPENILLDENFNAKVADFGLSKLIDRDQSQVVTIMRGTPGYLAPEWLSSIITEKVDVYSFGVVLLEILCGRRHFDRSLPEESMHLLGHFKEKLREKQLLDLVDTYNEDMQLHKEEVVDMMKVAAWCLQSDFAKRPSMSVVVKVLEGVVDVEENIDYSFCNPPIPNTRARVMHKEVSGATALLDSVLSGPR